MSVCVTWLDEYDHNWTVKVVSSIFWPTAGQRSVNTMICYLSRRDGDMVRSHRVILSLCVHMNLDCRCAPMLYPHLTYCSRSQAWRCPRQLEHNENHLCIQTYLNAEKERVRYQARVCRDGSVSKVQTSKPEIF